MQIRFFPDLRHLRTWLDALVAADAPPPLTAAPPLVEEDDENDPTAVFDYDDFDRRR
jgi:hypothetical protein